MLGGADVPHEHEPMKKHLERQFPRVGADAELRASSVESGTRSQGSSATHRIPPLILASCCLALTGCSAVGVKVGNSVYDQDLTGGPSGEVDAFSFRALAVDDRPAEGYRYLEYSSSLVGQDEFDRYESSFNPLLSELGGGVGKSWEVFEYGTLDLRGGPAFHTWNPIGFEGDLAIRSFSLALVAELGLVAIRGPKGSFEILLGWNYLDGLLDLEESGLEIEDTSTTIRRGWEVGLKYQRDDWGFGVGVRESQFDARVGDSDMNATSSFPFLWVELEL